MPPVFCFATVVAFAAAPLAAQESSPITPPLRTILTAPVEVDLLPDAAGRPGVMVMLNGRGPWRFAIDLGANALVVSDSVAAAAELPVIRTDTGTILTGAVEVAFLELGGARFEGMVAGVYPLPPGFHGILGFNVFHELLMTFDFPGRRFRLSRGVLPPADGATVLELAPPDAARLAYLGIAADATIGDPGVQPHIDFTLGGLRATGVLDTQAGGYLYLPDSLMSDFATGPDTSRFAGRGPNVGEMSLRRIRVADTLNVGHYATVHPIVTFRDRPGPMFGMDFLRHFVLTFDQRSARVRLEGPARVITIPPQPWEVGAAATVVDLAAYVGVYGTREVTLEGGTLHIQRKDVSNAPRLAMVPAGPDRFTLARVPEAALEFVRDGEHVVALRVRVPSGEWEQAARSGRE